MLSKYCLKKNSPNDVGDCLRGTVRDTESVDRHDVVLLFYTALRRHCAWNREGMGQCKGQHINSTYLTQTCDTVKKVIN